jgi:hypothetical protein
MILTLAWKEYREHRSIWLTMAALTGLLGFGMAQLVAPHGSEASRVEIATLTILGMAAAYGVVCGAMMLAGEHESGTLVFLDIFLGRRELLWLWKFLIGVPLVLAEALTVALVLYFLKQEPPDWLLVLIGKSPTTPIAPAFGGLPLVATVRASVEDWFLVLPAVTLEAYAWGLLGSSLARRVLSAAALAAMMVAPLWLFTIFAPPQIFFGIRLAGAGLALLIANAVFLTQSRESPLGPPPPPDRPDRRTKRLRDWQASAKFELERRAPHLDARGRPIRDIPVPPPTAWPGRERGTRRGRRLPQARSPIHVLWWLTLRQAALVLAILAGIALLTGFLVPDYGQVVWPVATLLIGVACGTATFAPEQRDRSYEFLATQHFPLRTVWNVKVLFWLGSAALLAALLVAGADLVILGKSFVKLHTSPTATDNGQFPFAPVPPPETGPPPGFDFGTLRQLLGPVLFFAVWLMYGFSVSQVFVLFCRKAVLAVLLSVLVAVAALVPWIPSLLCGSLSGWQVWLTPLALLATTRVLVRAWAGGWIKERRPLLGMAGVAGMALAWAGVNFAWVAWTVPAVGEEPLDRMAFRTSVPDGRENRAGQKIQEALGELEKPNGQEGPWLPPLEAAARLPVGVIEAPPSSGQTPLLGHLPACQKMTKKLQDLAKAALARGDTRRALEHLVQILALSRNLRNKAVFASYHTGVEVEESALDFLDVWFTRSKPAPALLRRLLDELNRHADETPPPLDCLRTECYRAGGLITNPLGWNFYAGGSGSGRVRERWLAGWIAASLDTPWEQERATRLWRLVWAGLFRAAQTPYWRLPAVAPDIAATQQATRRILEGWLPAGDGAGQSVTTGQLARWLDASWLADEALFAPVMPLRRVATRGRWRMGAARLAVALALYQREKGKPAQKLTDLVPGYLAKLPVDPYSGEQFHYRVSAGEKLEIPEGESFQGRDGPNRGVVRLGQGIVWSTGPDRTDQGGRKHGGRLPDIDRGWSRDGLDLITVVPFWP